MAEVPRKNALRSRRPGRFEVCRHREKCDIEYDDTTLGDDRRADRPIKDSDGVRATAPKISSLFSDIDRFCHRRFHIASHGKARLHKARFAAMANFDDVIDPTL